MNLPRLAIRALVSAALLSLMVPEFRARAPRSETSQANVVLTKLFPLTYPPLARQTRIVGDVDVLVEVRKDGVVKSAVAVEGHPLLAQSAIDSARQSEFECNGCDADGASLHLLYTFQFSGSEECCQRDDKASSPPGSGEKVPRVEQTLNHVTVIDRPTCICDPAGTIEKVRSLKCLYLWRCSKRYPE
jgi:hypothetical protein